MEEHMAEWRNVFPCRRRAGTSREETQRANDKDFSPVDGGFECFLNNFKQKLRAPPFSPTRFKGEDLM